MLTLSRYHGEPRHIRISHSCYSGLGNQGVRVLEAQIAEAQKLARKWKPKK
jgi:hypothetical protein